MEWVFFFPFACFSHHRIPRMYPQDESCSSNLSRSRKEWILKHVLEKVHGSEISQDPLSVMVIPGWGLNAKTTESALGMPSPVIKTRGKLIFFLTLRTSSSWVLLVVSLISLSIWKVQTAENSST